MMNEDMTAEEFWRGRCADCAHDEHPLRTCHEIIGAIGGDPSNGPDYCPCTIDYANGAMEAEIARLSRLIEGSDPASPEHNHDIVDGQVWKDCGACGTLPYDPLATPLYDSFSDPAQRVKRGGGHAIARAKVWSHADSSGEAPHSSDPNFSAATPVAGSTIPDRPLDVERLARALIVVGGFAGHEAWPVWRTGSAHEIAVAIVSEDARLAEAPVTGEV